MFWTIVIIIVIVGLGTLAESKNKVVSKASTGVLWVFAYGMKLLTYAIYGVLGLAIAYFSIGWLIDKLV